MSRLLSKERVRDLLLGLALLCATLALMLYPQPSMEAAKSGLALCYNVIIPSLFPFFVLSSLVVELGLAGYLGRLLEGLMRPLFHVSGACASAFALGFIGGYPVGAKTAISLYENGMCTKTEAERLLAFCNNSGPAFILGVVGAGVFASSRVGVLLYLAHAAASICIGILFRFYKAGPTARREERQSRPQFHAQRFTTAFTGSIKNSFLSTLNICAFVVFFTVVIQLLIRSGFLPGWPRCWGRCSPPSASPRSGPNVCLPERWRSPPVCGLSPATAPSAASLFWPPSCWGGPASPSTVRCSPSSGAAACPWAPIW